MTYPVKTPKELIEVALPLDDMNIACAREKSIRHGHQHLAFVVGATAFGSGRAVIFAQIECERLPGIIRKLALWEHINEEVLAEARAKIWKSWRESAHSERVLKASRADRVQGARSAETGMYWTYMRKASTAQRSNRAA